eukprot:11169580-Lingulodinium_polyedra.AAC.2
MSRRMATSSATVSPSHRRCPRSQPSVASRGSRGGPSRGPGGLRRAASISRCHQGATRGSSRRRQAPGGAARRRHEATDRHRPGG